VPPSFEGLQIAHRLSEPHTPEHWPLVVLQVEPLRMLLQSLFWVQLPLAMFHGLHGRSVEHMTAWLQ